MPKRSKVSALPEKVKAELDKKLVRKSFGDYTALAKWLAEKGFEISRSSLHRYGQGFEERLAAIKIATEQARAVAEEAKDDEGTMNEALIRLVQTKTFELLVDAQEKGNLPKIGVMIARVANAAVQQKKWQVEARKKALEEAAEKMTDSAKKQGVSAETIKKIRRDVLMMAG